MCSFYVWGAVTFWPAIDFTACIRLHTSFILLVGRGCATQSGWPFTSYRSSPVVPSGRVTAEREEGSVLHLKDRSEGGLLVCCDYSDYFWAAIYQAELMMKSIKNLLSAKVEIMLFFSSFNNHDNFLLVWFFHFLVRFWNIYCTSSVVWFSSSWCLLRSGS